MEPQYVGPGGPAVVFHVFYRLDLLLGFFSPEWQDSEVVRSSYQYILVLCVQV